MRAIAAVRMDRVMFFCIVPAPELTPPLSMSAQELVKAAHGGGRRERFVTCRRAVGPAAGPGCDRSRGDRRPCPCRRPHPRPCLWRSPFSPRLSSPLLSSSPLSPCRPSSPARRRSAGRSASPSPSRTLVD